MRTGLWTALKVSAASLLLMGVSAAIAAVPVASKEPSEHAEPPSSAGEDAIPRSGLWRKVIPPRSGPSETGESLEADASQPLTPDQKRQIDALEAIGYVDGSEPPQTQRVVTVHKRELAQPGLNFYTSGHAAGAVLRDMDGRELHRWAYDFKAIWPDRPIPAGGDYWRRAYLFESGDVIAIYEGWGIIRIDAGSNLIWSNPIRAHHDLEVMPNGDIYVLTRKAHLVPRINPKRPILEDFISILDSDGKEKSRLSLLEVLEQSPFAGLLFDGRDLHSDLLHTNSIHILGGKASSAQPWRKPGNALVSFLTIDTIAIVDMQRGELVKTWRGGFRAQHDPKLLDNGNLMLFDNQGRHRASSVIEFDPHTRKPAWSYRGAIDGRFYSRFCGTAARLPNGNTLITESGQGRAFEVTPQKEIVWEFHNPHRAGARDQYVASLLEVVRLPPDFPVPYVEPEGSTGSAPTPIRNSP